jgi:hypothetical protein
MLLKVPEVQLHEPFLGTSQAASLQLETSQAFHELAQQGVPMNLVVPYDDCECPFSLVLYLLLNGLSAYTPVMMVYRCLHLNLWSQFRPGLDWLACVKHLAQNLFRELP